MYIFKKATLKIGIFAGLVFLNAHVPQAQAADVSTWAELNTALATFAPTINLLNDITTQANFPTQSAIGTNPVILNGNGFTLDGNNSFYGFYTNIASLTLNNVTMQNFTNNGLGGAVRAYGNVIVINIGADSAFINNSTVGGNGSGGAIYSGSSGGINIADNVLFSGNRANGDYGSGGAISGSNVTIGSNVVFTGNQALGAISGGGGAISSSGTLIIGDGATFTNNNARDTGGAISFGTGNMTIETTGGTTLFSGNTDGTGANDLNLSAYIFGGVTYATTLNITGSSGEVIFNSGISSSEINYDAGATPMPTNPDVHIVKSGGNDLIFGVAANNSNFLGVFTQTAGTTTYHGGVLAGVNNFTNSTLNLWQTGATVGINNLNLTDAIVNSINDSINTFNIASFNATGANDFSIDINGANGTSDQFNITSGTGTGTINVSDFNVVNAPTAVTIDLPVFVGSISGYTFTSSETEVITPIYTYQVTSLGNGVYQLQRASNSSALNKDVFRGGVSTLASYHNQLSFTNMLFDRVYLETNEDPCAEFISPGKGRLWAKTYGASDKLRMNQGVSTDNRAYGVIVGADFPMVDLGEYWSFSPTLYVAYNGAHQKFEGVSMDQQGGQAGVMGTFRNGDFSTSVLGFAGAYNNRMKVAGNRDSVNNSFTGAAVKTAYDFRLRSDFVIQPTVSATYAVYGSQKWFSTYGNIDMKSGALQAWNVTPGINWIYKQEDWSAFAVTRYSYGNNNSVSGVAGPVVLPELTARSGYVEYGVGAQKKVGEISYFGQLMFQNGARSGAALQVGLAVPF